jgi:hypothetical protein
MSKIHTGLAVDGRGGTPCVPASIDGESGMDLRHRLEVVEARSWDLEQAVGDQSPKRGDMVMFRSPWRRLDTLHALFEIPRTSFDNL